MTRLFLISALLAASIGCEPVPCGPTSGVVDRVIDGDTIALEDGSRIRYLLVDTPENTSKNECFGEEATAFNRALVEGQSVKLSYDAQCTDKYDRLLAYVEADGVDVNASLIENGYACVLHIPPNGEVNINEFRKLENQAQAARTGLWGSCFEEIPCGN